MSFKRWKLGLMVAMAVGLFSAGTTGAVVDKATLSELGLILFMSIGTHFILYVQQNPVDKISFDTITVTKQQTEQTTTTLSDSTAKETKP